MANDFRSVAEHQPGAQAKKSPHLSLGKMGGIIWQRPTLTLPIDRFVQARLQEEGSSPAPPAAPEALLRWVSLDLTGLPPTAEGVRTFLTAKTVSGKMP